MLPKVCKAQEKLAIITCFTKKIKKYFVLINKTYFKIRNEKLIKKKKLIKNIFAHLKNLE